MRVPEDEALAEWDWAVTVDEAYQIACDAAGMDLVRDEPGFHYEKLVGFRTPYDTPERRAYWVWAETGDFARYGFLPWHWPITRPLEEPEVIAVARAEAARLMPDWVAADDLSWVIVRGQDQRIQAEGVLWRPEFPPIFPQPTCQLRIDHLSGVVLDYGQYLCHDRLEAEAEITYDSVLAAIRGELGADLEVLRKRPSRIAPDPYTTYLWHGSDDIHYHIAFTSGDSRGWATIDARTGELRQLHVQPIEPPEPADTTDPPNMIE
jgi:hypothetical protein